MASYIVIDTEKLAEMLFSPEIVTVVVWVPVAKFLMGRTLKYLLSPTGTL